MRSLYSCGLPIYRTPTAARVVYRSQLTEPPGSLPQSPPPQIPQSASQQMSSRWTPARPLLHSPSAEQGGAPQRVWDRLATSVGHVSGLGTTVSYVMIMCSAYRRRILLIVATRAVVGVDLALLTFLAGGVLELASALRFETIQLPIDECSHGLF